MSKKDNVINLKILENCPIAKISTPTDEEGYKAEVSLTPSKQIRLKLENSFNLEMPQTCEVTFYNHIVGVIKCRCKLENEFEQIRNDNIYLKCEILDVLEMKNRRDDLKVPLNEKIKIFIGKEHFFANAKNYSAGGIYFTCGTYLKKGERIHLIIETLNKNLVLSAEVIRCEKIEEGLLGYGCKFVELSNKTEAELRNYSYKIQREKNLNN